MSFIDPVELGRSTIGNLKNNTWDVYPFMKIYEDDAKALVAYVKSLEEKVKEYEKREEN